MAGTQAVAIAGIILGAFGGVDQLLTTANPWRGFQDSDSPKVVSYRVQHVENEPCAPWVKAFMEDPRGVHLGNPEKHAKWPEWGGWPAWKEGWRSWEPWAGDDIDAVKDCTGYPCDVKLNQAEAAQMKAAPKEERLQKFFDIVQARSERYVKTGDRKEYEFPGDPVEPWAYLEKQGLHSTVKRPEAADLWVRKNNLDPKRMKTLHQVLDRRSAKNAAGTSAELWVRDVYTDHYFDGWGEWASLTCDPKGAPNAGVTVVQALFLEVDLLKKNDIISRIGRGKLKGAIEESGKQYLDTAFARIKDAAQAATGTEHGAPGAGH
jgi:hypothetical protein